MSSGLPARYNDGESQLQLIVLPRQKRVEIWSLLDLVLGLLLWSIMYNGVLVPVVPKEATIVDFADDLSTVSVYLVDPGE